ncbi:MAG: stress protein [Gemmatimonadetes bacterium]|nr:stress protein [Gemmatimonadota bacterium]
MPLRRHAWLLLSLALSCVVPVPPVAPTPAAKPASCPVVQLANAASIGATIITLTNRERTAANLASLSADSSLTCAAQLQADQMARLDRMAHELPGQKYPTLVSRLKAAGYRYASTGENLAWGQRSPMEVLPGWMASKPHRANILAPDFRDMGVGYAVSASRKTYFVQVFGRRLY